MGECCISGFYSRLPIHKDDKVACIICRDNDATKPSSCSTYLDSHILPYCLPIFGHMGDYAQLDDWEDSETTMALERLCRMTLNDIFYTLHDFNPWEDREGAKKLSALLDKNESKSHRYFMIFEHYSVYEKIAQGCQLKLVYMEKYLKRIKGTLDYNIFHDNRHFNISRWMKDLQDDALENHCRVLVSEYMNNYNHIGMWLYDKVKYHLTNQMIDEIKNWINFLFCFDYYCHGCFVSSANAGQSWHHDKDYTNFRLDLLQEFKNVLDSHEIYD